MVEFLLDGALERPSKECELINSCANGNSAISEHRIQQLGSLLQSSRRKVLPLWGSGLFSQLEDNQTLSRQTSEQARPGLASSYKARSILRTLPTAAIKNQRSSNLVNL